MNYNNLSLDSALSRESLIYTFAMALELVHRCRLQNTLAVQKSDFHDMSPLKSSQSMTNSVPFLTRISLNSSVHLVYCKFRINFNFNFETKVVSKHSFN